MNKSDIVIFFVALAMMLADILSGIISAFINGNWQSRVMRIGLLHKVSEILCVAVGAVLQYGQSFVDLGFTVPAMKAICGYIIIMEIGSFCENIGKANPNIGASALKKLFQIESGTETESDKEE